MNSFRISAPARIHMNLLGMGRDGYRKNGGIGFAISGYDTVFDFFTNDVNLVKDLRASPLNPEGIKKLLEFLDSLSSKLNLKVKLAVTIVEGPKPHSGLGVGTTTKLALTEALLLANKHCFTPDEIVKLSGRGGTSGVGITTYFHGGFVLDGGIPMNPEPFGPSSKMEGASFKLPLLMLKTSLPEDWKIGLLQVPGDTISGEREQSFFLENTPISRVEIESACYLALMGVAASILEGDYSGFATAVNSIQDQVWKGAEWRIQSPEVMLAKEWLCSKSVSSVGLSSFGPALYFTFNDVVVFENPRDMPTFWKLSVVSPNNVGRVFEYV